MRPAADSRQGQAAIMVTVSLVPLLAMIGLVVDFGWGYYRKELCRTAAESAAAAGAAAAKGKTLSCGTGVTCQAATACPSTLTPTTDPIIAACLYAKQNGYTDGGKISVKIATGTTSSPVSGVSPSYWITATVSEQLPQLFSAVLGNTLATASARSTAGVFTATGAGGCVYILNLTATKALWQTASGDLESACGVWVNSSDSEAIYQTASAKINTGSAFTNLVGGYHQTASSTITPLPVAATAVTDPLASKTLPTMATPVVCDHTSFTSSGTATVFPGTYCGGLSITGSGTTTFSSGLYIMDGGGFNIAGSGNANGTAITILLTSDASHTYKGVSINGSGTYTFSAPTSGSNEGLLIVGDRTQASGVGSTVTGTSTTKFSGVIYLPKEALTYTGGSNLTDYTTIIADTLKMTGLTYIGSNYANLSSGNPLAGGKTTYIIE